MVSELRAPPVELLGVAQGLGRLHQALLGLGGRYADLAVCLLACADLAYFLSVHY